MYCSISFVDKDTNEVLFTERESILIPRINEMVGYLGKWYKVRQVYYTYHSLTSDSMYCGIEVNLTRSEFE